MLDFYYAPMACSMASHIALEEAGADYNSTCITIRKGENRTPEFLKVNPKGFVPILVTSQGTITENVAILSYIALTYPEARLLPSNDPYGLAQVTSFNTFLSSAVHVMFRAFNRPRLFADGEVAHAALIAKVPEMIKKYFGLIEDQLSDGREWIHGNSYSVSDPYLWVYTNLLFWDGDRGDPYDYPLTQAHRERVLARPATQRALKQEGVDDPAKVGPKLGILVLDDPAVEAALAKGEAVSDYMKNPKVVDMSKAGC